MEKKKISTKKLLETYGLLDDSIATMMWHMNIDSISVDSMKKICLINDDKLSEEELAQRIADVIRTCDQQNANYDGDMYTKLSRFGFASNQFYGGHSHKYNGIPDDYYGFGSKFSRQLDEFYDGSIYDKDDDFSSHRGR